MLIIDNKACTGCRLCEKNCPFGAILVVDEKAAVQDNCTLCGACMNVCSEHAIAIERAAASPEELAKYKGVFIWAECDESADGEYLVPKKVVLELLGVAKGLAGTLGEEIQVLVLSDGRPVDTDILFAHGADGVIRHENKLLWPYSTDAYTTVISAMVAARKPNIFLLGATPNGRDLAPRVGARLKLGLTADCTMLEINDERQLVQTRPAFGGNIMATIMCDKFRPQMATVRPHVMSMPEIVKGRAGTIVREDFAPAEENILTKVLEVIRNRNGQDHLNITGAEVIVSGGRGMLNRENFILLQQLANEIGAVVGASRSAVDAGWMPHDRQVGQTGKTVRPKLYIACGISGAIQHMVGLQDADIIIAINRDKDAPIFQIATYGIVGDLFQIVPALTRRLRELRKAVGRPERTA